MEHGTYLHQPLRREMREWSEHDRDRSLLREVFVNQPKILQHCRRIDSEVTMKTVKSVSKDLIHNFLLKRLCVGSYKFELLRTLATLRKNSASLESLGWCCCCVQAIAKLFATFINSEWFPILERILAIIHGNNAICTGWKQENKIYQHVKWYQCKKLNLKKSNDKMKREWKDVQCWQWVDPVLSGRCYHTEAESF